MLEAFCFRETICKIYEVGEDERQPYIAVQRIHGAPLGGLQQAQRSSRGSHAAARAGGAWVV